MRGLQWAVAACLLAACGSGSHAGAVGPGTDDGGVPDAGADDASPARRARPTRLRGRPPRAA